MIFSNVRKNVGNKEQSMIVNMCATVYAHVYAHVGRPEIDL